MPEECDPSYNVYDSGVLRLPRDREGIQGDGLFHCTDKSRLMSISERGLDPTYKKRSDVSGDYLYFTTSPGAALKWCETAKLEGVMPEDSCPLLLRVDDTKVEFDYDPAGSMWPEMGPSYKVKEKIPPSDIDALIDGEWKNIDSKYFLYHFTDEPHISDIKEHGLKAHTQYEQVRGGPEPILNAIRKAEDVIEEEGGCDHGKSVFFYDRENKEDRCSPVAIVDSRKLTGLEGKAYMSDQHLWELLVSLISEGIYPDMSEEDWEETIKSLANEYCDSFQPYPVGGDTEYMDPPKCWSDDKCQIFVEGDIPPRQ